MRHRGFVQEREEHDFIDRYEGNIWVFWMISTTVVNWLAGKGSDFFKSGTVFLG
jgi:hypothetical protein